jgi:exonuclease V gamma subunit
MEKPLANATHKLTGVRRNHSAFLEQIRNNLIAHRPKNAREKLQALESLDVAHAMRAFQDVLSWLNALQADLWTLLLTSGKLPAHVAQQLVGRERRERVSHYDWSGDS